MDIKQYIESGILELYVLGQLSPEEEKDVQEMQAKHIEIQREIYEISLSLEKYGQINSIKAPVSISDQLFQNLPAKKVEKNIHSNATKSPKYESGINWNLLNTLLALVSILGFTLYFIQKSENKAQLQKYESALRVCDSIATIQKEEFAIINQINKPDNKIINLLATPGYAGISVYLHYNAVEKKNFLQLVNLPDITKEQVFQLWALRDGVDPMPLDIFVDKNKIIPVTFVDNTVTYAITIEPNGGSKAPSLEKLIGTLGII